MSTWTGLTKPDESSKAAASSSDAPESSGVRPVIRQGLSRMGTWGFGGTNANKEDAIAKEGQADEEDDRHIRFTIGGAGRRLTKEDFLKEIQSLDPKARCEIIDESDAPAELKDLAKKDASDDSPGSSRIFGAKNPQRAASKGVAKSIGAAMARAKGAELRGEEDEGYGRDHESGSEESESDREKRKRGKAVLDLSRKRHRAELMGDRKLSKIESHTSGEQPETEAERKRREQALKGVDDVTDAQRGRSRTVDGQRKSASASASASGSGSGSGSGSRRPSHGETPAEKRRREAALGVGSRAVEEDSEDDDTPRVPPPVAKSRGIRFAQSPVRRGK
jgi:sodium/hydrogen antiporter